MTGPLPGTEFPFAPYRDAVIAVGTRHRKERQFRVPFRDVLGAHLLTPDDLDTDRFGTFTGEVSRVETAIEAARAKARLAMTVTGLPFGLASEAGANAFFMKGPEAQEKVPDTLQRLLSAREEP